MAKKKPGLQQQRHKPGKDFFGYQRLRHEQRTARIRALDLRSRRQSADVDQLTGRIRAFDKSWLPFGLLAVLRILGWRRDVFGFRLRCLDHGVRFRRIGLLFLLLLLRLRFHDRLRSGLAHSAGGGFLAGRLRVACGKKHRCSDDGGTECEILHKFGAVLDHF